MWSQIFNVQERPTETIVYTREGNTFPAKVGYYLPVIKRKNQPNNLDVIVYCEELEEYILMHFNTRYNVVNPIKRLESNHITFMPARYEHLFPGIEERIQLYLR